MTYINTDTNGHSHIFISDKTGLELHRVALSHAAINGYELAYTDDIKTLFDPTTPSDDHLYY